MKLLALDTSTEQLSLAVMDGEKKFAFEQVVGNASSAHVLPQIQALLSQAQLQLSDLDGIAYGAGPGSFTGVRIATGVTQGLALSQQLPVVGVSTLLALAEASGKDKVIACLDARMGEVYHAVYAKQDDSWQVIMPPSVCKPELVPLPEGNGWVGIGSGWKTYGDMLSERHQDQLSDVFADLMPSAQAVLQLSLPKFMAGEVQEASQALPLYVRNRVALTSKQRAAGERL